MNALTYSQRRRLIHFLWAFVSNGALPFILGFIFALISVTHSVTETFFTLDKSGLSICVDQSAKGGNHD